MIDVCIWYAFASFDVCIWYAFASFSFARGSHEDEAKLCRDRRRSVTGSLQGNGDGGSSGRGAAAVDESKDETADRVAKPDRLGR